MVYRTVQLLATQGRIADRSRCNADADSLHLSNVRLLLDDSRRLKSGNCVAKDLGMNLPLTGTSLIDLCCIDCVLIFSHNSHHQPIGGLWHSHGMSAVHQRTVVTFYGKPAVHLLGQWCRRTKQRPTAHIPAADIAPSSMRQDINCMLPVNQ